MCTSGVKQMDIYFLLHHGNFCHSDVSCLCKFLMFFMLKLSLRWRSCDSNEAIKIKSKMELTAISESAYRNCLENLVKRVRAPWDRNWSRQNKFWWINYFFMYDLFYISWYTNCIYFRQNKIKEKDCLNIYLVQFLFGWYNTICKIINNGYLPF